MEYKEFLNKKHQVLKDCGFTVESSLINSKLFDYQADIVKWALKKGRAAIFADTGLGKTIMQCEWARHVAKHTNKPVLILAPLCISEQTQREAKNILDMDVVRYSQDLDNYSGVYVTNYEQIRNIDFSVFGGIVLDESSILKHRDSKTRLLIILTLIFFWFALTIVGVNKTIT